MASKFGTWWQKIKQHPYATVVVVLLILILFILSAYRFGWDWTGFNSATSQITITNTSKGNYTATVSQPSKSLWDWLSLLGVLAIPAVVGLGAAWYTAQQGKASERENKDNQREAALQDYINKMSELLVNQLRQAQPEEEKRIVARARTLNVLRQLNSERKGYVIQFLYESHLLGTRIIDLSYTQLSEANLYRARLSNANLYRSGLFRANLFQADLSLANLSEAYLVGADFRGAKLCYADLSRANLSEADLRGADLREAKLYGAKMHGTLYNKKKIQMRDPQGEELLSLEPTSFPDEFKCEGIKYVDCYSYDKPEVCQVKEEPSSTAAPESLIDLSYIDLSFTDLSYKTLSKANLYQARLIESKLVQADLTFANLSEAILHKANLSGANLSHTNLSGAILQEADLTDAKVSQEQLARAASLKDANMPDGSKHP